MNRNGFTLLELMIAAAIILVTLVGLIETYIVCFGLNEIAKNENLALQAVQSVMETIRNTPETQFEYVDTEYNNETYNISGMPAGSGIVYVRVDNSTSSSDITLFDVAVGACWKQRGDRIIGGCNGSLVFSNPDDVLNSSVNLRAMMSQR